MPFHDTWMNGKVFSEEFTYAGTALSPGFIRRTFSTLKAVKSVYVNVIMLATLDLMVEYLGSFIGVLYSSS